MKMFKKSVALLLVLLLVTAAIPTVFAVTAKPGQTVPVSFGFTDVYGVDGTYSVSDPNNIVTGISKTTEFQYSTDGTAKNFTCTVNVSISSDAKEGQTVTVHFNHATATNSGGAMTGYTTSSQTITIGASGGGSTPVKPSKGVDYSELERQIAIANGLNQADYTKESWEVLSKALAEANAALSSKDQAVVDAAAKALADAIAALVKMDYSALEEALKAVQDFIDGDDLADLWVRLVQAFLKGKELLTSGDQEAVNATASEIMSILEELKARMEELRTPEVVTETVEVEVLPEGEYCNIPMHRIWPILFFISLILNVGLIVVIVVIVSKKKNNAKDKTPLVDYDIGDDA